MINLRSQAEAVAGKQTFIVTGEFIVCEMVFPFIKKPLRNVS